MFFRGFFFSPEFFFFSAAAGKKRKGKKLSFLKLFKKKKKTGDMSDPVCIYDGAHTKRFYLGMFQWGGGSGGKYSRFMLAVSRSSDPVKDGWDGPFTVRNDGLDQRGKSLPGLEACGRAGGCMGDYPTMGMDTNSLWVGFNLFGSGYNGVLVLALSKKSLVEAKKREPAAVAYSGWPGDLAFTVHPTTTQSGSQSSPGPAPDSGGAMFLLSTGPATQNDPSRNEVAVWAATDTAALAADDFPSRLPSGGLRLPKISAPANVPVPAYRDTGAFRGARLALDQPSPGIPLDGGDGRTAQAVFSGGLIWCAAQTAMHVSKPDSPLVIGVVYWAFEPLWTPVDARNASLGYSFVPKLAATGYVGESLIVFSGFFCSRSFFEGEKEKTHHFVSLFHKTTTTNRRRSRHGPHGQAGQDARRQARYYGLGAGHRLDRRHPHRVWNKPDRRRRRGRPVFGSESDARRRDRPGRPVPSEPRREGLARVPPRRGLLRRGPRRRRRDGVDV